MCPGLVRLVCRTLPIRRALCPSKRHYYYSDPSLFRGSGVTSEGRGCACQRSAVLPGCQYKMRTPWLALVGWWGILRTPPPRSWLVGRLFCALPDQQMSTCFMTANGGFGKHFRNSSKREFETGAPVSRRPVAWGVLGEGGSLQDELRSAPGRGGPPPPPPLTCPRRRR